MGEGEGLSMAAPGGRVGVRADLAHDRAEDPEGKLLTRQRAQQRERHEVHALAVAHLGEARKRKRKRRVLR